MSAPAYIKLCLRGIAEHGQPERVITGAQYGVDTFAFNIAMAMWREGTQHVVVVPAHAHNIRVVELAEGFRDKKGVAVLIERMEHGTTYLHRNDRMLDFADCLMAFPKTSNEIKRSGTWHCIRQARARGLAIVVNPFEGDGWTEPARG